MSDSYTEVPEMGPTHFSLPGLERKLLQLTQQVAEEKQLLRDTFKQIYQIVSQREAELLTQLDAIPAKISASIEERRAGLQQLTQGRVEIEGRLQTDRSDESLQEQLSSINVEIESILSEQIIFPRVVSLRCDKDAIQEVLGGKCIIHTALNQWTAPRTEAIWHSVKKGERRDELCNPSAMCIDPTTQLIYVGERSITQRIQVFTSEGKHFSTLRNEELLYCHSIKVRREHIYVSTGTLGVSYLLKLDKRGVTFKSVKTNHEVFGVCIEGEELYTCSSKSLTLQLYNLELQPEKKIHLKARSFGIHTTPRDLVISDRQIFVLFSFYSTKSYHLDPIQVFQLDGTLVRSLATGNLMKNALYFCLDPKQNILVSDFSGHCIRIFSHEGSLIQSIGRRGQDQGGELYNPTGIAVDCRGRVVTVGLKQNNLLQSFRVSNSSQ